MPHQTLKALNDQLQNVRSEIAPRRKFAFKPTSKVTAAASPPDASGEAPATTSSSSNQPVEEDLRNVVSEVSSKAEFSDPPTPFTNLHHVLRTGDCLQNADKGILMSNNTHSVIRCFVPSVSLTIRDMRHCVIASGPINGAAHITGLTASVLIISCRQLRMHNCRDCTVYLQCGSNPVIEDCSGIRFAPLPGDLVRYITYRFSTIKFGALLIFCTQGSRGFGGSTVRPVEPSQ